MSTPPQLQSDRPFKERRGGDHHHPPDSPRQRSGGRASNATPDVNTETSAHHEPESTVDSTAAPLAVTQTVSGWPDWDARRDAARAWVEQAGRPELEDWALRQHDRADCGWLAVLVRHEGEALIATREASYAVSAAISWSEASRRPSHAELERRRAVVGPLCREVSE